ncbi:MAG: class I SAM-dependent methyltransferase [Bacteroidota bacterium]
MHRIISFFRYLSQVPSPQQAHSPFVTELLQEVIRKPAPEVVRKVEAIRKPLLADKRTLVLMDYGAGPGGKGGGSRRAKVSQIARSSGCSPKKGQLLFQLCTYLQPKLAVELGTNLGMSALYQLQGMPMEGEFITIEGDPGLSGLARENIRRAGYEADFQIGPFEMVLPSLGFAEHSIDLVFIDGDHSHSPTLAYFHFFLPLIRDGGCIIFDDIHWSRGMTHAWKTIIKHAEVSVSVDLFQSGLAFIRRDQPKEEVSLWW